MKQATGTIILIALSLAIRCSCLDDNQLPLIWSSIEGDKSYHIIYQLEMLNEKQTLNLEEWADFESKLFRLDIITLESRLSILTNGQTGESIHYKPFICGDFNETSEQFSSLATLFKGYALNEAKPETKAYGLGPLWIKAKLDADQIKRLPPALPTQSLRYRFLSEYNSFLVQFKSPADDDVNYDLKLYFDPGERTFLRAVEWVASNSDGKRIIKARARLSAIDAHVFSRQVFELPVGYGCKRSASFDHGLDIEPGQALLHAVLPNQASMEVSVSRPSDNLMHSWENNRYSLQILRGKLRSGANDKLEVYYAALTQFREAKTARYRRIRRVWSSRDEFDDAIMYTIDENEGGCKMDHVLAKDYVKFPFPGQQNREQPLSLSVGSILNLFNDQEDYHLIKVAAQLSSRKFKDAYFEKRLDTFLLEEGGEVTWSGPVSIVKHIDYVGDLDALDRESSHSDRVRLSKDYRMSLILFLYSDDNKRLQYKIVVDLLNRQDVSLHQLLSHIDIRACVDSENIEDIMIKYPIREPDTLATLQMNSETILAEFARNLFRQTPIAPLQVTRLQLSFDQFFVYLKMSLLDLSSYHTFDLRRNHRLLNSGGQKRSSMLETMASSLAKCSAHCDYYGCYRFSYDSARLICRLELRQNGASTEFQLDSDLYSFVPEQSNCNVSPAVRPFCDTGDEQQSSARARHHLSPRVIMEMFQNIIELTHSEETEGEMGTFEPDGILNLWFESVGTTKPGVHLKPIAVLSDMDSLRELAKRESEIADGSRGLSLQYVLMMEGKYFHPSFGSDLEAPTYEDCASKCEAEDCRAFSYCAYSFRCIITLGVHSSSEIESKVSPASSCDVYTLDNLSKFENYGPARYPTVTQRREVDAIGTARDCANHCMEEDKFTCQGFYFCETGAETKGNEKAPKKADGEDKGKKFECLLQSKHIDAPLNRYKPKFQPEISKGGARKCEFYSRSYLAQFDQFHGKTIELASQENAVVLKGYNTERCAQRCIEGACLAFDVCVETNSRYFGQSCRLAPRSTSGSRLATKAQCTTFVLSDRSQFRGRNKLQVDGSSEPDKAALNTDDDGDDDNNKGVVLDEKEFEAEKQDENSAIFEPLKSEQNHAGSIPISGSHWFTRFSCFAFGVLLGVGGLYLADLIYVKWSRQRLP